MSKILSGATPIRGVANLAPDPHNANLGTARGREALERSLREYGPGRAVLIDRNDCVIAGNKRRWSVPEARLQLGRYVRFYSHERPHQPLGYRTPVTGLAMLCGIEQRCHRIGTDDRREGDERETQRRTMRDGMTCCACSPESSGAAGRPAAGA
jgi:hypothetical protein